jgi:hypothetical protein
MEKGKKTVPFSASSQKALSQPDKKAGRNLPEAVPFARSAGAPAQVALACDTNIPVPKFDIVPATASSDEYIELHARSAFSFLEGSSLPEELIERAAELGQKKLALLDAHGVYGAPRFHMAAKKKEIRALIGAEVGTTLSGRIPLLVENRTGYQNLCRLVTRTKLRGGKPGKLENPAASLEEFAELSKGLVCLTGGDEGPLASIFRDHEGPAAAGHCRARLEQLYNATAGASKKLAIKH